jgi:hypothetical protein
VNLPPFTPEEAENYLYAIKRAQASLSFCSLVLYEFTDEQGMFSLLSEHEKTSYIKEIQEKMTFLEQIAMGEIFTSSSSSGKLDLIPATEVVEKIADIGAFFQSTSSSF